MPVVCPSCNYKFNGYVLVKGDTMTQVYHAKLDEVAKNLEEARKALGSFKPGDTIPSGLFNRLTSDLSFVLDLATTQEANLNQLSQTLGQLRQTINGIKALVS